MLSQLFKYGAIDGKIHAMLGSRLSHDDFDRLMNMPSVADIAIFLASNRGYRSCFGGADLAQMRRAELERRLRAGVESEHLRLSIFATSNLRCLLRAMLLRTDAFEILRFLRLLSAGHPQDFDVHLTPQILERSHVSFTALSAIPTFEGLLQAVAGSVFSAPLKNISPKDGESFPYIECETAVQGAYFRSVFDCIERGFSGTERAELENYFKKQCDFYNITAIMRIKKHFEIEASRLIGFLLPYSLKFKGEYLSSVAHAENYQDAMAILKTTGAYADIFAKTNENDIEDYRFEFFREGRRLLRNGKPDAFTAVMYLDLKETELRNLITITECVRYEIPPNRISAYLSPIY